jgi:hypothetical protein
MIFKFDKKGLIFRRYRKTPHIVPRTYRTFLFFLGVTSGILCAAVYFFSTISGPFSHNLDRDIDPRSLFFEFFFVFSYSYEIGTASNLARFS